MKTILQFIKFSIVGLSNTLISLAIYYVCLWLGFHYLLANLLGFLISVWNAYYWSSKYVFKDTEQKNTKVLIKVYASYGATFLLSTILLMLFVQGLGISDKIAPILNLCVTVPLNFLLNKIWVYKDK